MNHLRTSCAASSLVVTTIDQWTTWIKRIAQLKRWLICLSKIHSDMFHKQCQRHRWPSQVFSLNSTAFVSKVQNLNQASTSKSLKRLSKVDISVQMNADFDHMARALYGYLQMPPAPSSVSQLSSVRCGQSRMEASVPKHCTSSIEKVAGTEPKRECIVCTPVEYPSILWNTFL